MQIIQLKTRKEIDDQELFIVHNIQSLIKQLNQREVPKTMIDAINSKIRDLNAVTDKNFINQLKTEQKNILKLLEKEMNLVPKHYYRNLWIALGMTVFGIPFGVAFSAILKNSTLFAIGLPIGLGIGSFYGTYLDKKAKEEGRQLDIEIK